MKTIPLTQGKFALVDDADYEWINQLCWHALQPGSRRTFYATRTVRMGKGKRKREWMHRLILGLQPNDKRQCDHIDGNGLNNVRSNLRPCTNQQNHQSQRKWKAGTSKYKGVWWRSDVHKWQSYIRVNLKLIYLGYFDSEADAATAYNEAALKHFGEFALLNTI